MVCFDTSKPKPERKYWSDLQAEKELASETKATTAAKAAPDAKFPSGGKSVSEPRSAPEAKSATEERPVVVPKRPRRDRTTQTVLHTLFACALLAGGLGLYFVLGSRADAPSAKVAETVRPGEAHQIGQIKISTDAECKKRLFDNASGAVVEAPGADCAASNLQNPNSLYVTPTNRLDAVRRGFNR